MAESDNPKDVTGTSENDSLDISELASLNEDYSVDFIEQLQSQLTESAGLQPQSKSSVDINTNDAELFEEQPEKQSHSFNDEIEDNFIKKYKAKLQKQQNAAMEAAREATAQEIQKAEQNQEQEEKAAMAQSAAETQETIQPANSVNASDAAPVETQTENSVQNDFEDTNNNEKNTDNQTQDIETVTGGNITEKPLSESQKEYKDSLNYIDGNTKYSKYVIYIDPENKDFIDSLTVKERKNLINRIIREQDSVVVTKKNLNKMQAIITHAIIAILTIAISVPCIYWVVNASLESTINNYKASKSMFQTLYKEHGKIKSTNLK